MGDQLAGLQFFALHRFQQHRGGNGINQPGGDGNICRPQFFQVKLDAFAMHADIGNMAARPDNILSKFKGCRHTDCLDSHIYSPAAC